MVAPLHPFLVCPRCRGALTPSDTTIRCADCGRGFPVLSGVPCLLSDPHREIDEWGARAEEFVQDNASVNDRLLAQLVGGGDVPPTTRTRIEGLRATLSDHRQRLLNIATAAGITPKPRSNPDRDRVPGERSLTAYYHQLHRDWGWDVQGEFDEVERAVAAVEAVLDDAPLGHVLVLGAGACRLPWELHRRRGFTSTLAVDINPLPFLIARRLIDGESMSMFEFPIRPRSSSHAAVDRRLPSTPIDAAQVSPQTRDSFALAFADGMDPPVRPASFNTVITPWFIDQIPKDLAEILPVVREVLEAGGTWVNHGPLIYHPGHTAFVHRYCVDEVLAMVADAGFEIAASSFERMPYMVSPAGSQGRTEMVLTFRATKLDVAEKPQTETMPPWLTDPVAAVPILDGLDKYVPPHPMFATIVGAIDGQRSAADIGKLLADKHGVPAAAATEGVQAALSEIYRALSQHRSN